VKYTIQYGEYIVYEEVIEANTHDEAGEKFAKLLTDNEIEPVEVEIDLYEITEGD